MNEELKIELYKSLKEEYRQYGFYIQSLTKMKFIAISSIITFFIINEIIINLVKENNLLISIGILLIPMVSFFLDLKILEITLHIRSISDFLEERFDKKSLIPDWENLVWSKQFYSISRTYLTIFTSVGISFIILWASLFLVGGYFYEEWKTYCLISGILFSIGGILFSIWFYKRIWASKNKR